MTLRSTAGGAALAALLSCTTARTAAIPPAPAAPDAATPAPAAATTVTAATIPPLPAVAADPGRVYEGWKLFHIHCFRCHGFDAEGGGAPNLRDTVRERLTRQGFIVTVLGGRPDRGMPTWAEVLQPADAERIYEYVVERSIGRLPPGKPPRPDA